MREARAVGLLSEARSGCVGSKPKARLYFVREEDRERGDEGGQDGSEGHRRRCPRRSICGCESAFAPGTAERALTVLITHGALFV